MTRKFTGQFLGTLALLALLFAPLRAHAAGTFKLKSTEVNEVSGAWHVFVTIELPRAPATPHVPIKFLFTKTAVYERALVDNRSEPVTNRMALQGQTPSIESLDVDFADGSGKVHKTTRFDFGLTSNASASCTTAGGSSTRNSFALRTHLSSASPLSKSIWSLAIFRRAISS